MQHINAAICRQGSVENFRTSSAGCPDVSSYRDSVAEMPNQFGFVELPIKVKGGKALAQQAEGVTQLS